MREGVVKGTFSAWAHLRSRVFVRRRAFSVTRVARRLYLGGEPRTAADAAELRSHGIRAVVCLMRHPARIPPSEYGASDLLSLPTPDGACPTAAQRRAASAFIRRHVARGPVFVHCKSGVGRSAVIAIDHIAETLHVDMHAAHSMISRRRRISQTLPRPRLKVRDKHFTRFSKGLVARHVTQGELQEAEPRMTHTHHAMSQTRQMSGDPVCPMASAASHGSCEPLGILVLCVAARNTCFERFEC